MSVLTMLERLRTKNFELKGSPGYVASLGYRERPCQGERQKKQTERERDRKVYKDGEWVWPILVTQKSWMLVVSQACL